MNNFTYIYTFSQVDCKESTVEPPLPQSQPLNLCLKEVVSKERVVEANVTTDTLCLPQSQAMNLCLNETSLNETHVPQSQPLDLSTCRGGGAPPSAVDLSALPVLTPTSLKQLIPTTDMSVFYEPISSPVSINFAN
jgi:hypothetical protein